MADASGSDNVDTNPMTNELEEVFAISASTRQDSYDPCIEFMQVFNDNRLFLVDSDNSSIKRMSLTSPSKISTKTMCLRFTPVEMVVLPDGDIVMTTFDGRLVSVMEDKPRILSTDRNYWNIALGPRETLIVRAYCPEDSECPGRVDMLRYDGSFVRTVALGPSTLTLCVVGNIMLTERRNKSAIHRVDIDTGKIVDTIRHPDLYNRFVQARQDKEGFVYVLFHRGTFGMVRSPVGKWRYILNDVKYRDEDDHYATAMHVSKCGMVIVAWKSRSDASCTIKGYRWV